jgi:hemolysin activation/secretion protein
LLTFADHGHGHNVGLGDVSIGSVGLGLRLTAGKTLSVEADVAQVIDDGGSQGSQQRDDRRLHFQVGVSF